MSRSKDKQKPSSSSKSVIVKTVEAICARFGQGAIMALGGDAGQYQVHQSIPSGSMRLDRALGIGGYPQGRIIEIYGPESSGKTTLTLHAIAEAQKQGKVCAFIDAEHAIDVRYAEALGVNLSELLISQPDTGEQALEIADTLARSQGVGLIVVDSVAALIPKAELEGGMGDHHLGLQARLMSQGMRKLSGVASQTETSIVFINQLRHKIGVTFGSPEVTTGGNALKYYASVRIDIRRIASVKEGDRIVANRVRTKVVKNKCAPPFSQAEFEIVFGQGIHSRAELLDEALEAGLVKQSGSWFNFGEQKMGQGRATALEWLKEHPAEETRLREDLMPREEKDVKKESTKAAAKKTAA